MANSEWPDQRTQAIKYLGEVTTHAGEFIERLIEFDMQNMAPRATPWQLMHEEARRVNPRQKNSGKKCHPKLSKEQPSGGGTMQPTEGTGRKSRDPRLKQRHPTVTQSTNTHSEDCTTATGKRVDKPPTKGGDDKSKEKKANQDRLERRQEEKMRQWANQGLKQREESLERWEEKTVQYMEYLTNKGDLEAFIRDEYWHSLPDRVRDAEQRCKEYKGRLAEFLTEGVRKPNLRICDICGQIFLEKRKEKDTLNAHMYNMH